MLALISSLSTIRISLRDPHNYQNSLYIKKIHLANKLQPTKTKKATNTPKQKYAMPSTLIEEYVS